MRDSIFLTTEKDDKMNKFLIPALGLAAALAFSVPTFQVTPAGATTTTTATTTAAAPKKKVMHKKVVHKKACKPTKTHKCPVVHKKKKKTTY